jgi:hypothetical protein
MSDFECNRMLKYTRNIIIHKSLSTYPNSEGCFLRHGLKFQYVKILFKGSNVLELEPLLCDNGEISKYTRAVSKQRIDEHVPRATNGRATMEVLLETGFYTRSVPKYYKQGTRLELSQFCTEVSEERTCARRQRNNHCWGRYQETSNNRLKK